MVLLLAPEPWGVHQHRRLEAIRDLAREKGCTEQLCEWFVNAANNGMNSAHVAGRDEGLLDGWEQAILQILTRRGVRVPDDAGRRIHGCADLTTLKTWLARAMTVDSIEQLFAAAG
jgi:hypothetical protein